EDMDADAEGREELAGEPGAGFAEQIGGAESGIGFVAADAERDDEAGDEENPRDPVDAGDRTRRLATRRHGPGSLFPEAVHRVSCIRAGESRPRQLQGLPGPAARPIAE